MKTPPEGGGGLRAYLDSLPVTNACNITDEEVKAWIDASFNAKIEPRPRMMFAPGEAIKALFPSMPGVDELEDKSSYFIEY